MTCAVVVRDATLEDLGFLTDSNAAMALETESKALDRATLGHGIAAVFAQPTRGFYLIAEQAGRAVGCLLVTYEWSDWRNGTWWWLQSVYVAADARRSGVFGRLYACVEARAQQATAVIGIRLYVERDNEVAIATYRRLGLAETHYRMMETGADDAPRIA